MAARGRRARPAVALLVLLALWASAGLVHASVLEDAVGRVNALCLTGSADGNLTGAQINGVTCSASLTCLLYQSFSAEELVRLQYGDYSVISPSCPPGQTGVSGYLLDADMAQSAKDAVACLRASAARYQAGARVSYCDTLFSFDTVPYIAAGPSAGLAFVIAAYSAVTDVPVCHEVAVTGEIKGDGSVHPVGGVAAKLQAAATAGVGTVILPEGDREDLPQVPPDLLRRVRLVFVSDVSTALFHALGPYGPEGARYATLAGRYVSAVNWARGGDTARADAEFAALQQEMPEDYSLGVWRQYFAGLMAAAR